MTPVVAICWLRPCSAKYNLQVFGLGEPFSPCQISHVLHVGNLFFPANDRVVLSNKLTKHLYTKVLSRIYLTMFIYYIIH